MRTFSDFTKASILIFDVRKIEKVPPKKQSDGFSDKTFVAKFNREEWIFSQLPPLACLYVCFEWKSSGVQRSRKVDRRELFEKYANARKLHHKPVVNWNHFSLPSRCGQKKTFEQIVISGVFVRIKDKNLHVECFKCATCGTSLKNQGYFNLHNKLYCDIHARMAALNSPPPNAAANGLVPVTFPP